eukprot:jgi/Ulvmu1/9060/UM005_0153.1
MSHSQLLSIAMLPVSNILVTHKSEASPGSSVAVRTHRLARTGLQYSCTVPHHVGSVSCAVVFQKRVTIIPTTAVTKYDVTVDGADSLRTGRNTITVKISDGTGETCTLTILIRRRLEPRAEKQRSIARSLAYCALATGVASVAGAPAAGALGAFTAISATLSCALAVMVQR